MITVREYVDQDDRNPFRAWLRRLDVPIRARIQARILRSKLAISAITSCLVTACGKRGWRSVPAIACTSEKADTSSCCYCGDKRSQTKDIERAKMYWTNYLKENKHGKTK